MSGRLSRETWIGVGVTALAVAAMAVDHLMGDDPAVLEDPAAFVISSALSIALAVFIFGRLVPRTKASPYVAERAAKRGMVLSLLAMVGIVAFFWLGFPFVLGGGAVALGLLGRGGERSRLATAAAAIGALVVLLGTVSYAGQFVEKL